VAGRPLFGPRCSITSSAVAIIVAGMVSPIAPAVLRLTSSDLISSDQKHRWIL
jgi:hypothetical protein